jgi:hypothetical protein
MIRQVFEFKEITTLYEASSVAGTLDFYVGLPNAAVALPSATQNLSLPVTTTRQTKTHQLGQVGSVYKVRYVPGASTGVLRPYEATLQVRVIGLYLLGSQSDVWDSGEIALGV